MSETIFENLPTDPELAFAHLEVLFRRELMDGVRVTHEDGTMEISDAEILHYINRTIGAARELEISDFSKRDAPSHTDSGIYHYLMDFIGDIDQYLTRIRIKYARRRSGYSVAFDAVTKQKLQHHLGQLRELVRALAIGPLKKDRIQTRINALAMEVERELTPFDVAMALMVEAAGAGATAYRKLKPAIDGITKLFAAANGMEEPRALSAPPKQLEGPSPSQRINNASTKDQRDEEIPI